MDYFKVINNNPIRNKSNYSLRTVFKISLSVTIPTS